MNVILRVIATAIAVWVAALLLPGISVQTQDDTGSAAVTFLLIAVVIGLVNTIVKPIAQVLSGCFIILTFGLFLLVVNTRTSCAVVPVSDATEGARMRLWTSDHFCKQALSHSLFNDFHLYTFPVDKTVNFVRPDR